MIVKISNKKIRIKFDKSKPEGDVDRMANNTKARKLLNWYPKVKIEIGLRKVYKWCELELV